MVDRKDFFTADGDVNDDLLNAITVLMAGLGIRTNGSPEDIKKSAAAARHIAASYAKHVMEEEKIDRELYERQQEKERSLFLHMTRPGKPTK